MAGGSTNAVILKHIHTLYHAGAIGGLTDGQLLERFVDGRDGTAEVAFAALMERHGPMVLDVCRQMLGNPHEAQDAFQATFFVLVRKARSVRKSDSVASWLHGVARQGRHAGQGRRSAAADARTAGGERAQRRNRSATGTGRSPGRNFTRRFPGCPRDTASRSCSATSRA